MTKSEYISMDGNEAAARVAYAVSEVATIYPITPSSPMAELADLYSASKKPNIWGHVTQVVEMQSEGGAAGALHGALQAGALTTTFTASQGLLLMIPNMYKIAGELTPAVFHIAARSLACQGLSIFGDHQDVMAARDTGFAMLCSASVQESHDLALIAHAATLESRVPFMHFFDGFRTSHEINKIAVLSDDQIRAMINDEFVLAHRNRALNPEKPFIRGTAQNPDVYFQGRESVNTFYQLTPGIVQKAMDKFAKLTGRTYNLVEYYGASDAEKVIVIMGSGASTVRETVAAMNAAGQKVGMIQIHLYRPFPKEAFLKALPESARQIAVLDRTKEPGSAGEPIYLDVMTTLAEAASLKKIARMPMVIGGRYGLSSKEFTPAMVKGVYDELGKAKPKNSFTVGINDDVTFTSIDYDPSFIIAKGNVVRSVFYGLGSDGTVGANKNSIKIIGNNTDNFAQAYFVYDSKKAGSRTVSHLRFGPEVIDSPYLIQAANFIGVHQFNFVYQTDVLARAAKGATLLLNSPYSATDVWRYLPDTVQKTIIEKQLKFYVIDAYKVAQATGMGERINTIMQTGFFHLSGVLPPVEAIAQIKKAIEKTYSKKGEEIVKRNFAAVDQAIDNLEVVSVPSSVSDEARPLPSTVSSNAPEFVQKVTAMMMADRGDELPVSALPVDGTYPVGTTKWEKRNVSMNVARWDCENCIQCGRCSMVCPHGVIRAKRYDKSELANAPDGFNSGSVRGKGMEDKAFTLQVYVEDCTGCGMCQAACPAKNKANPDLKAINVLPKAEVLEQELASIDFFETIKVDDPHSMNTSAPMGIQFVEPLFEFSGACAGCGETPYVKMISQLFGNRMMVANATGCSSIYGGNLPTTPWTTDKNGRGPVWSNSLFEDNAEFGFGFRICEDQLSYQAVQLLEQLKEQVGDELATAILDHRLDNADVEINAQHERVAQLKTKLSVMNTPKAIQLLSLADHLVKRSIWMLGGDGWAYDIGYGGLDHVLACGRNVNIMVVDTGVYSNTGGQASKATPMGAIAKFAAAGKQLPRKDLGLITMSYGYVYVAQIAIGANPIHALKAVKEAENYDGPSLIIAYSHCIAHGMSAMNQGLDQQKRAVDCGYWSLYRYNPALSGEGKSAFILDSKAPSIALKDYVYQENRFKALLKANPEEAASLLEKEEAEILHRLNLYKKMTEVE